MNVYKYSEWSQTAETLHMILQMIGKTKLALLPAQPEWGQILLSPTARGFTSGFISDGENGFDIYVDLYASEVIAYCIDGRVAQFSLRDDAYVSDYYRDFMKMLNDVSCQPTISTIPQEVGYDTRLEEQTEKRDYSAAHAQAYFENCIFAYRALTRFASPYRCKKILPSLFWGTFDMTTVLFSGLEKPFSGSGTIERVAFDEQFAEFGFWPGDPTTDEPSFFAMPYPFLKTDLTDKNISPKEAFFSTEKKEFFLPLKAVLQYEKPLAVVAQFCTDAFQVIAQEETWPNMEWFCKPLDYAGALPGLLGSVD